MRTTIRTWLLAAAALLLVLPAAAAPLKTKYSTIDLIAESASLPANGGTVTVGFYIEPDVTWHAYWSNPGDAGMEPTISWDLPDGFSVSEFEFPTPHLLPFGELITYGYEEPIMLLAELTVPDGLTAGDEVVIGGAARWVVCDDQICVPERSDVSMTLVVGDGANDSEMVERFATARNKLPKVADWPAQFTIVDDKVLIDISATDALKGIEDVYLYIESKSLVQYGTQAAGFTRNGLSFAMGAGRSAAEEASTQAILVYNDAAGEHRAVELTVNKSDGTSIAGSTSVLASDGGLGFWQAALFAFVGGIILNLMPCVFPILSMKALSLVNMGQQDQRAARESGLIYTAGILVAFAAIGASLLVIRSAGEAVGWGFQMQNPLINTGIGLLMVLIAMNLFGAFEIGTRIMGVGQGLTEGGERKSAFFTGLLAVVVATPCTAPFMAGALGYALAQPPATSMAIFLSLGFGLAFPYLLLSFIPALGRAMPKPGPWMETFKHFLAFPMLLTALWLFWVVGKQLGATSMTIALLAALALAFALWAYGKAAMAKRRVAWYVAAAVGLAACVAAFMQVEPNRFVQRAAGDYSAGTLGGLELEHFDPDRVQQYIADGQPTFVYFTADWCISCKANERVALSTDTVAEAINSRGIKVVEGDWTTEDPVITGWLEMYDRAGVPLYLYFPSGSSLETVTILPQILTPGIVVDAIAEADAAAVMLAGDDTATDADYDAELEAYKNFQVPEAEPEWVPIQAYIEADERWHAASEDERGEHPDIVPAQAAATAIVNLRGEHEKTREAAEFLVDHTFQAAGGARSIMLGLQTLTEQGYDYEQWPQALFQLNFSAPAGWYAEVDNFFEDYEFFVPDDPITRATAQFYAADRQLRFANSVDTPMAERDRYRQRGIEIATGLSRGVEDAELVERRRFDDDGEPIPFPTLAEAERDLLYNLNFLTVGDKLPDVMGKRLDGVEESVSTYRGQALLLDFWATWCGPCIESLPKLAELDEGLPEDEFEILSISVDEKLETVTEFQSDRPMDWANWHVGPRAELLQTWAVSGYPTYMLINHEGAIVARTNFLNSDFVELIRTTACGPAGRQTC
ncbi:MAG: thioredoxin family protein [Pseudomonadota bacterium]